MMTKITKKIKNNLSSQIQAKYISSRRDYGNANNSFADVTLKDYIKVDIKNQLNILGVNYFLDINNVFNKSYEDAYQYNSDGRNVNFGVRKNY